MLLQRVQTLRDAFCTSIFGDFEQVEDLVYTFDEGPSTPITEDMLDSLASEEAGFDSQLVTRARLQAACFVARERVWTRWSGGFTGSGRNWRSGDEGVG